jgi:hypothetical protein
MSSRASFVHSLVIVSNFRYPLAPFLSDLSHDLTGGYAR